MDQKRWKTVNHSQRASLERLRVALLGNKVSLEDMNIPDFQPSAVVIKTVWEVINPDDPHTDPGPNPTGTSAKVRFFGKDVPLQEKPDGRQLYPELKNWNGDHLHVDLSNKEDCSAKYSGPNIVFALGCFHYRALSVEDFRDVNPDYVRDIKYKCHNTTCYMILVGLHIMARETAKWVWMTYWLTTEKAHPGRLDPWSLFDLDATINNESSETAYDRH